MALQSPFELLVKAIIGRPGLVLGVLIAMVLVSLVGMTFVTMATGTDTYLNKDTERGMLLDKYTHPCQSDSIMLLVEADDVLNPTFWHTWTGCRVM